jgi:predicted GH43/DUF377 family glycosyl hydrolase
VGESCLGLAFSSDAKNFVKYENNPVILPTEKFDIQGCEDPHLVFFDGTFYLTYVGNDGGKTPGNICLATSTDLLHWKKYGEILQPKYEWESGQVKAGVIIPNKIDGKYWMYYQGEREPWHTATGLACSEDLIHWEVVSDGPVLEPREKQWDSLGTEPGAVVVLQEGILVIYNGWDETHWNKAGWALFSKRDPSRLIARCEEPMLSLPGRHVFATSMVEHDGEWILYWGADDKWVDGGKLRVRVLLEKEKHGILIPCNL